MSYLVIPLITQQTQLRTGFVVRGFFREQRDYIRRHDRTKICTQGVGLDGIWYFSQITQNLVRLARNNHIVMQTTQTRL